MGRFHKGLFLGGLLGAGLVWLNITPKGKEMRDKLVDHAAEVYADVKERVLSSEAWDKMTKQKYVAMVREVVDKYAVQTGLAVKAKEMIVKIVAGQWKLVQKELRKKKG